MEAAQRLEALFKPADEGYVFRAPNPWILGEAKHYYVTGDQKAQIVKTMDMPRWAVAFFWLAWRYASAAAPRFFILPPAILSRPRLISRSSSHSQLLELCSPCL